MTKATMKINVRGLEFFEGDSGDRPFTILAHGTVTVDDIAFQGVALCWSEEEGLTALAPAARCATGVHAVRWDYRKPMAREIARRMADLFVKMGGTIPVKVKRVFIPVSEVDLDGTPRAWARNERIGLALDRMSKRDGVYYFTEVWKREEAADPGPDEPESEDAGLRRVLGCAIEETMERAGL